MAPIVLLYPQTEFFDVSHEAERQGAHHLVRLDWVGMKCILHCLLASLEEVKTRQMRPKASLRALGQCQLLDLHFVRSVSRRILEKVLEITIKGKRNEQIRANMTIPLSS